MNTTKAGMLLLALTLSITAHAANDWSKTLLPRDLDGNAANGPEAYFDTTQNLTWIADWSFTKNLAFADAVKWAEGFALGGYDDWRLPVIVLPQPCQAYNCTDSEVGALWYSVLGSVAPGAETYGPFRNVTRGPYWLAPPDSPTRAWSFEFQSGFQGLAGRSETYVAIAVRDGDTVPVPEPATIGLLAMGLALMPFRRRGAQRRR